MGLCAAGLVLVNFLLLSTRSTLWDRDEPRFARATVEMVESGNYLYPTFNGNLRPDKPILSYWLMSIPVRLFGPTELAFRFFSAVGTAVTCLATFAIGMHFLGGRGALWAAAIVACSLQFLVIGAAATADAVLLPAMVGVMVLVAYRGRSPIRLHHAALLGLLFGWGILVKGPVALLPVPVTLAILWRERRDGVAAGRWLAVLLVGLAVGVVISLAWAIPANVATDGEFLRLALGRHVIGRAAKPMEGHGGKFLLSLPYYAPILLGGFFPWTLHLPGALSALFGGRLGGRFARSYFLAWIVLPFVVMSLVATKLPHYILFIYPALALVVAATLEAARRHELADRDRDWLRGGVWFFGPPAMALSLGLLIGPWLVPIPGLVAPGMIAGAILLATALIAMRQQLANRFGAGAVTILLGMVAFEVPLFVGILPALERVKVPPAVARRVRAATPQDTPVATYHFGEPSLNLYLGRPIEKLSTPEAVATWAARPGRGVLLAPESQLQKMREAIERLPLSEMATVEGFNYSKGKALTVVALLRGEPTCETP